MCGIYMCACDVCMCIWICAEAYSLMSVWGISICVLMCSV